MSAFELNQPTPSQSNILVSVFPRADAQVVSALSAHTKALTRYLAQVHDLTFAEASETIDAFLDVPRPLKDQINVA